MKRALFIAYMALAVIWLGLGAAGLIVSELPTVRAALRPSDAPIVYQLLAAADPAGDRVGAVLDYLFSTITLVLAVMLFRLRHRSRAAGLLAFALVGTAVAYNLTGHRVLDAAAEVLGEDYLELPHLMVFHAVAGVCYVNALVMLTREPPRGRRWPMVVLWTVANVLLFGLSMLTGTYHTGFFLVFYGVLTPVAGLAVQAVLARRSSDEVRRRQSATVQAALFVALACAVGLSAVELAFGTRGDDPLVVAFGVFRMVFLLVPVALVVAVLRLRLWDADWLVNRSVVFGVLVILISLAYAGVVLTAVPWAYAGLAAVLIGPARGAAHRLADRLVHGPRRHALQLLGELRTQLDSALDINDLLPSLAAAVGRQVRADACFITVDAPGGSRTGKWILRQGWAREHRLPVAYAGSPIGVLTVGTLRDALSRTDRRLVRDAANRLGPTLHQLRLRLELDEELRRSDEADRLLRQSCRQVVAACDAERRRLERNIHDGAQQTLIAVGVFLDLVEQDRQRSETLMHQAHAHVMDAIGDVQAIARGLHPAELANNGLAAALRALPGLPGRSLNITAPAGRLPAAIEAAVYYACVESVQNASRHGDGAIDVVVVHDADRVTFTVRDLSGAPFPSAYSLGTPQQRGVGLESIAERMRDVGGTATVEHDADGTTVRGSVPLR